LREGATLFERIRGASESFTPSFRKVAEYVLTQTHDVAFSPAARVASAAGVSESVVVRFAGELGYAGYPAMQQAAQAFVRSQLQGPFGRIQRLPITSASTPQDVFRSVLAQEAANLHATADYTPNHAALGGVADALLEAQRVFVVGFRGLRHLAGLCAFLLDMASLETVPITHSDAEGFQMASRLRKGDAMLAFAFTRYTRTTKALIELARVREAATIVICDKVTAPAARRAHHVLQAATESPSFHNSYVAAVACINAVVMAVAAKARARVTRRLRDVEDVIPVDDFDIE
jgi:DNA-binding MurR/RpiR family transcriptional regulator